MGFTHFFVDRPIFAAVLSIFITIAGALAYFTLPVSQYPQIAPPTVTVTASYPGANAELVADTVAAPIELQINGVDNMIYMTSQITGDGNVIDLGRLQGRAPISTRHRFWCRTVSRSPSRACRMMCGDWGSRRGRPRPTS